MKVGIRGLPRPKHAGLERDTPSPRGVKVGLGTLFRLEHARLGAQAHKR